MKCTLGAGVHGEGGPLGGGREGREGEGRGGAAGHGSDSPLAHQPRTGGVKVDGARYSHATNTADSYHRRDFWKAPCRTEHRAPAHLISGAPPASESMWTKTRSALQWKCQRLAIASYQSRSPTGTRNRPRHNRHHLCGRPRHPPQHHHHHLKLTRMGLLARLC